MTMIIYAMNVEQPEAKAMYELLQWQYKNPQLIKNVGRCLTKSKGHGIPVVGLCGDGEEKIIAVGYKELLKWLDETGCWIC